MKKTNRIIVRISDEDKETIRKNCGRNLSEYVRLAALGAAKGKERKK